jgi:hypothetical protein
MSIETTSETLAVSRDQDYFALCCETPLKVRVGNNGPGAPKSSRCCRRRRPQPSSAESPRSSSFFQRIGLQGALWGHVRFVQRTNRYSISESLEALLYPLILGLGRIVAQRFGRLDHWRRTMLGRSSPTHVSTITIPLLERAFAKLPEAVREVRVHADGAFFDHKIIEFIEQKCTLYAIVARLTGPLKARVGGLPTGAFPRECGSGISVLPARVAGGAALRSDPSTRAEEPSAQLHLFRMGGYSYQVLLTSLSLTPLHLWRFYNQRARAE